MVLQIESDMSPEHRELYAKHIAGMKKFVPTARKMARRQGRSSPSWRRR